MFKEKLKVKVWNGVIREEVEVEKTIKHRMEGND
jgi:hypothetical protein